jgi:PKD repeat protein
MKWTYAPSLRWVLLLLLLVACSSNDLEARFSFLPDDGDTNTEFTFDAGLSISVDTDIISYVWDFGDGNSATGEVVTHVFDASGDYNVTLTVRNGNGTQSRSSQRVLVDAANNQPPTAVIGVSPITGTLNTRFNFDGTASFDPDSDPDDPNTFRDDDYTWTFGDGTTAEGAQVSHVYDAPGEYDVQLIVRDPDNADGSTTVTVTVADVSTRVRAVHAAPDVGLVDVAITSGVNDVLLSGVPYAAASAFQAVAADIVTVTVTPEGSSEPALVLEQPLAANRDYTAIALGTLNPADNFPLDTLFFAEDSTTPAAGEFTLSVVHAAAGAPEVDVYVLSGELGDDSLAEVNNASPLRLAYRAVSPTLSLPVSAEDAAYRVIITLAGEQRVVYDSGLLTDALRAGVNYTAVAAIDPAEDALSPVQLVLLSDQTDTPFVTLPNVNVLDEGSNDTPARATDIGELAQNASVRTLAAIEDQGDVDVFAFSVSEATELTARTQSQALGSSVDTILTFHSADGTPLLSNDDANDDTLDSAVTVLVPAGDYLVSVRNVDPLVGEPAAFYDLIISSDEIRANDLPDYGASAGTFTGDSNAPNIGAFSGNALAVSAVQPDGDPLEQPMVILVDTPAATGLPILFDADAVGVLEVILEDLSGQSRLVKTQAMTPQAVKTALGGTFTFNFPGETIERNVDASATLSVPTVTAVARAGSRVTVTFANVPGANTNVEVFGRTSAAAGRASGTSPLSVPVSVTADEAIVVSVISSDRSGLQPPLTSTQRNVSQYLYYSEHAE